MPRRNRNNKNGQQRHGASCPCGPCRRHRSRLIGRQKPRGDGKK